MYEEVTGEDLYQPRLKMEKEGSRGLRRGESVLCCPGR